MTEQDIEALFPFYVMDALSHEEHAQVERYARSRPEVRVALDELAAAAAELPMLASPVPGTTDEKPALMARIRGDLEMQGAVRRIGPEQKSATGLLDRSRRLLTSRPAPAFAGLVLVLILLLAWALTLRSQLGDLDELVGALESEVVALGSERVALQEETIGLATENAALREQLLNQRQILIALGRTDTETVAVSGTDSNPQASGNLFVSQENNRALLTVSGLAPLPAGQDYQLWLIQGDQPTSAGVFAVDDAGRSVYLFPVDPATGDFDAVGVSIEPTGGSQQPTGDIVLFGSRTS